MSPLCWAPTTSSRSSGPNYFTRIDTGGAFDMRDSEPTKAANTQFSNAWTIWAAGQFVGSVLGILPKTAFATMMSAYKASVDVGKIPGPRWSNFVQQHLDNEYIAYLPLIVAFSLIAAFVVAGRPFLTRPYAATTKVGAAESC